MNVFFSHDNQISLVDGARFFYMKEFQPINVTRIIDLENHHYANLNEITDSGKYH